MRTEAQYLWDIIEAADAVDRFIGKKTMEEFLTDDMLRSAVYAKLIIVGEAVSRLPDTLTSKYPAVPWHQIRGFRNAVIHGYFKVDWDIIWTTATKDIQDLSRTATEMLDKEFPQFRSENA